MEYTKEKLEASLRTATNCCQISVFEPGKNGYVYFQIPIHESINGSVHYELHKGKMNLHFESDGYESLIKDIKEFIDNNKSFETISSPCGGRFGCEFKQKICATDVVQITEIFKQMFDIINPIVEKHLEKIVSWSELAEELYKLKQKEIKKLPYHINIVDELHANENAHSRILQKLLLYKSNGEFSVLKSFVAMCAKNSNINKNHILSNIKAPNITAEAERIDCLIEEQDHSYAIIIENKIKGATDQIEQIQRYYQRVLQHTVPQEHIHVVYLTREGGEPDEVSLTPWVKEKLGYSEQSTSRFIPINYRYHILPWLKEEILPEIKRREELLYCAVVQYIDYLEGLMGVRESERSIYEVLNNKLEEQMKLEGSIYEKWLKLYGYNQQVAELQKIIMNSSDKYTGIIKQEFEELAKTNLGKDIKNQIYSDSGYFQIFIPGVDETIHFEWLPISMHTLCLGGCCTFVLHDENNEVNKATELAVNEKFMEAVKENGFEFCYDYNENARQRTIIRKADLNLVGAFSNNKTTLSEIYQKAKNLVSYIQDQTIREENKNLTEIRKYLIEHTGHDIDEPWLGFELKIIFNKNQNGELIIESNYGINKDGVLEYRIMITVRDKQNWTDKYENFFFSKYPNSFIDKETNPNRYWFHLESIKNPSLDKIKDRLLTVYNTVKEIVVQLE